MIWLHRLVSIADWLFRRTRTERELDAELQAFVEMSAAEKVRDGLAPAEARRQAMLELGGVEQVKERVRTARHGAWLDEIARDVRYALRMFGKNPGFTLAIVLTLALGIGANTAVFSLIDALMLRWLPVANPQELVQVSFRTSENSRGVEDSFSYPIVRAMSERTDVFAGLTGFSGFGFEVGAPGSLTRVPGALVTGGYYETLGVKPVVGRLIARVDDQPGAPLVAVVSYGYWERHLARSDAAVGQTLRINGVPVTVAGVSPRGFTGANVGSIADITMAVSALPQVSPSAAPLLGTGNFWLRVLARPAAGLSRTEATERLNVVWSALAGSVIPPHWPASRRQALAESVFELVPGGTGWSYLRGMYRSPLYVLMAVVGVVLLIACANVASLLLARASTRRREVAVRLAIGAGRGRIVRQLLVESTLLSLIGAAVGLGLAWISSGLLVEMIASGRGPIDVDLTPNWHVLAFTSAVAILTGVAFGVAPALQTTAAGPAAALKEDARIGTSRSRLLSTLVSAQVALSLVLLAGAGLFVRTLQNLRNLDPGFNPADVLLVDLEGRRTAVPREILDDIQRLPGVFSASLSTHTPLSGAVWSEPAVPVGVPLPERDNSYFIGAGPGFFTTMRIHVLSGREFSERDVAARPGVAIVNEAFAQRHFPNQNPVGKRLSAMLRNQRRDLEIVGLARNTNAAGLRASSPPTVYVAYAQLTGDFPTTVSVRVAGPIGRVRSEVQQVMRSRMPDALIDVQPLSVQVAATMFQERMMATLATAFGLLALALACVGVYGMLAYSVAQRTREIGIRMALGARASRVVAHVMTRGVRLVLIGIAIGLPAAWAASRWVESMLFGLTAADPIAIGGAIVLLTMAAHVAAYLPARRASRVDPLTALRHE